MSNTLPMVGAAMQSKFLADHLDWLKQGQRDLEIQDPAYPDFGDLDWNSMVPDIRAKLDGYTGRMGIHGPFMGLPLAAYDRLVREAVQTRMKQALDFCAEISGSHMVIHSPTQFLGNPFLPSQPDMGQEMLLNVTQATLAPVITHAEQLKITLVIENIYDKSPSLWVAYVRCLNSEYVRNSLDIGHAFVNHRLGAPTPDYWAREAISNNQLAHLHIQDTDGYADRHWAPGEGEINFHSLFKPIKETPQQPRLILELMDHTQIEQAAQYLAGLGLVQ